MSEAGGRIEDIGQSRRDWLSRWLLEAESGGHFREDRRGSAESAHFRPHSPETRAEHAEPQGTRTTGAESQVQTHQLICQIRLSKNVPRRSEERSGERQGLSSATYAFQGRRSGRCGG